MHVAGVNVDPATFEHLDPDVVGNRRELLISELSGKGTVHARARDAGISLGDEQAAHLVERVKELEHRGYHFEAADGSFELLLRKETGEYEPLFRLESWRAIVEKRADGRVETEATIKIWVDGERYVRTAEGNGPVNALDRALRDALVEIYPHLRDIDLVNFKVRILDETKGTGAVTRVLLDASDGEQVWGSIGVSENMIEASWEALVDSLEYGMRVAGRSHERRSGVHSALVTGVRRVGEAIPLARPVLGEREEERVLAVLRSGQAVARTAAGRVRAGIRRAGSARPHASAVSSGTAGLHLALRASRRQGWRRGDHHPALVRGQRQRRRLRAGPAGVRRHRPGDLEPRSRRRRCGGHRAHHGDPAGAPLRLSRRHGRVRGSGPADRRGRLRGARRDRRRRNPVGATRSSRRVRLLRQQAAHHRRGRDGDDERRAFKERIDSERNQGRAPEHGLARPRPARLQLPPVGPGVRAGPGPARAPRRDAGGPIACRRLYSDALGGHRGATTPMSGRRPRASGLVRLRGAAPDRVRSRHGGAGAAANTASRASRTSPPCT